MSRQLRESFLSLLLTQSPHRRQIDDVPRPPAPHRTRCFTADDQAPAPRRANQLRRIADEIPPLRAIGREYTRRVADFEFDAALDGDAQSAEFEEVGDACGEVKGDEVAVEVVTGLLERGFVSGTDGDEVVGSEELGNAVVLRGVSGNESAAAEDA